MYIYQFAFFRQAHTEITKAATNFEKSAGKLAYAKPLYNNHDHNICQKQGNPKKSTNLKIYISGVKQHKFSHQIEACSFL
jgi:hypothetical protein